jgi:2-polyprenyl-3-methyl-5-hydroxy-6-metoxy-1,4-benzoquinol methylase
MLGQTGSLTGQLDEDRLCDIGCGGGITLDLS